MCLLLLYSLLLVFVADVVVAGVVNVVCDGCLC